MLRDQFSLNAGYLTFGATPAEALRYTKEMVRCQERLLSDAMHTDHPSDYDQLHKGFKAALGTIQLHWDADSWPPSEASRLYEELEQEYRIALMGLGGRAAMLADSGRIADPSPYFRVMRDEYSRSDQLATDVAGALVRNDEVTFTQWFEWDIEGATHGGILSWSAQPERYPLTGFAVRLMELCTEPMQNLNFHGRAQRALDWFTTNADNFTRHAPEASTLTIAERFELATTALRAAVLRDEVDQDYEIIRRELSPNRVSTFKSDAYAGAFSLDFMERLFDRAGAFLYVTGDAESGPEERGLREPQAKSYLTDSPGGALIGYAPLDGKRWGRPLSNGVLSQFCEALDYSSRISAPLDTPDALLQAIDRAIQDINTSEPVAVLLAGDWIDLQVALGTENPEGYVDRWRLPEDGQIGEIARYRGHPIFIFPHHDNRRLYVVEPAGWGCFIRAQSEDAQDLRIEIEPIPADRARELLEDNPNHFASQPDEESKLRKLQTYVEILISGRTGFRVKDPSRARVIVPADQEQEVASDLVLGTDSPRS